MPTYTREDQAQITVYLDGSVYSGWDSIAGGELDSNTVKIRVGGLEKDIGGPGTRSDLTLTVQLSDVTAAWWRAFDARVGRGAVTVALGFVNGEGARIGVTYSYTGTLKTVTRPDMDASNSSPGAAKLSIVVSCDQVLVVPR